MSAPTQSRAVDVDEALRTVAVNSSFSASRALSKWFKRGVRLNTDGFVNMPLGEVAHAAGEPDAALAAVHMPLAGRVEGDVLLAMPEAVAMSLVDLLTGQPPGTTQTLDEFQRSCIQETGNIVGTAFANTLSQWLNLDIVPAAPTFIHDMACAIVQPLVCQAAAHSDSAWLTKTEFEFDQQRLEWFMMLLLSDASLDLVRRQSHGEHARDNALHTVAVNAAYHASRAMSKWLKRGVRLSTEGFSRVPLAHVAASEDEAVVAIQMEMSQQFHGHLLLVLKLPVACDLADLLAPGRTRRGDTLDELDRSCLQETANIVATAFVNSLSKWLDITVNTTPPQLCIDLRESVFDAALSEQAAAGDDVLLSRTVFRLDGRWLDFDFFLLPTPAAFRLIETICA